ncbi:MAG: UDP-N-acetylmuramate--L-alanine ligase, partial [Treponema sp.]|nr:UDP-N-acetylmuramate--L-alanine ligase [Treponema sp.]
GFGASGDYRLSDYRASEGEAFFKVAAFRRELCLRVPGRHQALNAAGALALCGILLKEERGEAWNDALVEAAAGALREFRGAKRRSELIGRAGGIVFMDDYAHHPTAIRTTIAGLRAFHPGRRIFASFMSHTYSRTEALLDDFAEALLAADALVLHKIYASAREKAPEGFDGTALFDKIAEKKGGARGDELLYVDEPADAFEPLTRALRPGDLFLTLGAGDNWPLGERLFQYFDEGSEK